MQEMRYMISDTAKKVEVEAHVLRYWEEELCLNIARNEMGHRYYTTKDILVFQNIKKLKEQGFQLKTIKMVLPELENENVDNIIKRREELNMEAENMMYGYHNQEMAGTGCSHPAPVSKQTPVAYQTASAVQNASNINMDDKMQQFQMILGNIVAQALHNNNEALSQEIGENVSERVLKQINCVAKEQEEREEERYKRLDEIIRNTQQGKKEQETVVSQKEEKKKKEKKGLFARKRKVVGSESPA
jgi:DNA-binding transcriptional MerR regulator